jgi:hypothetical protein
MWAALEEGYKVQVLVDADAINTFKVGWKGKDDIEEYKIPENLRQALATQFKVNLDQVPKTYGDFLIWKLSVHGEKPQGQVMPGRCPSGGGQAEGLIIQLGEIAVTL